MSSRPKSEHLFITCNDTGDLQEKEGVGSVVNKLLSSSSNGKYKQVINTNLIKPKFSACSQIRHGNQRNLTLVWHNVHSYCNAAREVLEQLLQHGKMQ